MHISLLTIYCHYKTATNKNLPPCKLFPLLIVNTKGNTVKSTFEVSLQDSEYELMLKEHLKNQQNIK
jgi:hypothetical protein